MPHGSPALTGGREAEGGLKPLKRADCLSEASFCPLGGKPTGVARRAQPESFLFGIFFFRTSERKSAKLNYHLIPHAQKYLNKQHINSCPFSPFPVAPCSYLLRFLFASIARGKIRTWYELGTNRVGSWYIQGVDFVGKSTEP